MKVVKSETPEEEVKFTVEDIDDLKEDVTWLAEDVISLTDALHCTRSAAIMMLDIIMEQDEQIKALDDEIRSVDDAWLYLFWVLAIWNAILSVLFVLSICNVL